MNIQEQQITWIGEVCMIVKTDRRSVHDSPSPHIGWQSLMWQPKPAHKLTVTDVTAKARTQDDSHWCDCWSPHTGWQSLMWQPKPAHRLTVTHVTAKVRTQADSHLLLSEVGCNSMQPSIVLL